MSLFPDAEYAARLKVIQAGMAQHELGALLLTTEHDILYLTGFLTRFWQSPTRPWYLLVPASGKPIAVIPSIGAALMGRGWIEDIRTWPAPVPGDDGVGLLAQTLKEVGGPVGIPSHLETHLRMPLADFEALKAQTQMSFGPDHGILANARAVKSEAEIAKIETICSVAGRAFARMGEIAGEGVPLSTVFRNFQRLLLEEGADWVPYLSGGAGPDGYDDVISPASDTPLKAGDVLMLDTGAMKDGYFCDYDRNFSVGQPSQEAANAHSRLMEAVAAGLETARPGACACDLWRVMADIVGGGETTGRLGHALGLQLTEGLSLIQADETELKPGMVITLEPGIETVEGRMMVHEENIVITTGAPRLLSPLAGSELTVI
ncbi:M24 family metallopeptidase [Roseovarius rhodophyticola]|uniref:Xaa-Pro peptidase family protein n=1 Tax=Roseovarius rhodophyticola TaxID=3080827 RepID=A0ABZ2TKD2_9RHOB|nr:Xaa-Pro peptidase family protein [Roseovarius sp. W115]MDV2928467.1 Xaa-Pro peptidase family protein [Roseovarius sp. W115]